jgi:mRNA interferase MazF
MIKGEIWSIELPSSDLSEQMGSRLSAIIANVDADIVIVIPFTSNKQALRFKNTILIEPNLENGLKQESILLVFQLRAIDKNRIKNKIGILDSNTINQVDLMIKEMLKI